ncbi:LOW QUALITY PROTEIN: Transposase [Phytophthora palmivora]|uniref:Transposase n=1 Tax=Phytophthora palmivora TaxID=4796 RepID=A0A2P4X3G6_9STRA|nr:LOW QUALITY PROTEIN: Transposase [Phytophthora palmivora]
MGLDKVMTLRRFKQSRQALCIQCVEANAANNDRAARVRSLLNLLQTTGSKYVEVGHAVALDEASVAFRSKCGKPLLLYSPMKTTGKYHFGIYMLCCSTFRISLNYRLYCARNIAELLNGATAPEEIRRMSDEIVNSSSIRQCVLEVVRPVYYTRRVINSDNYYTSYERHAPIFRGMYSWRKKNVHLGLLVTADRTMVVAY